MTTRSAPIWYVAARKPGAAKGTLQRLDVSTRVKSFTFTDVEKGADKLALTVDNYDYSLFDRPLFGTGNILEVSWGYPEVTSRPRECVITKITGGHELKVEALGKAYLMMTERKPRSFAYMKRSEIARQIAHEYDYTDDHIFIDETPDVEPMVNQATMTDHMLLEDMARREGMVCFFDYRGFHWHKRDLKQAPRRAFVYFIDPGRGDITSPITVENDLTAKPAAVVAKGIDPKTKKPIDVKADDASTKRDGLGKVLVITAVGGQGGWKTPTVTLPTTAKNAAAAQREADGVFAKMQLTAVQISFTAVGDPLFEAKSIATMSGFSPALAGNYYFTEVTHTLGSGYSMSVKARRDGRSTAADASLAAKNQSSASQNAKKADDPKAAGDPKETLLIPISTVGKAGAVVKFVPAGTPKPKP